MKKILVIGLFVVVILIGFYTVKSPNPVGLYVAKHNVNTIDSLWIEKNGHYTRHIYNMNGEFLYTNEGEWKIQNKKLLLSDFFPNDDQALKKGYNFDSVLMTFSVPLEKSFGREAFDYDETTAKYRFYKLYFE